MLVIYLKNYRTIFLKTHKKEKKWHKGSENASHNVGECIFYKYNIELISVNIKMLTN